MKYDGMTIFSERDEFGLVEVVENRVTRKLHFDSPIEQSCVYINAPMTLNFEYQEKIIERVVDFANTKFSPSQKNRRPLRALMLGMGGGTMATHLFHTLPNLQMTVVELRQTVIDCAYRFFQLPNVPEIEAVQSDAIEFIAEDDSLYDVIMIDLFDAEGLPSALSDTEFQNNLWKSLSSPGLLIFNLWYRWEINPTGGRPVPNEESEIVIDFWQAFQDTASNENAKCTLNRYNAQSSQNLILELLKR